MTYKTRQEVLRAAADWMDVCEKAGVQAHCRYAVYESPILESPLTGMPSKYEFPLALLEGKEVWKGDTVYDEGGDSFKACAKMEFPGVWAWNPHKPVTVMVELTDADIKFWNNQRRDECMELPETARFYEACKKALEGKCSTEK